MVILGFKISDSNEYFVLGLSVISCVSIELAKSTANLISLKQISINRNICIKKYALILNSREK